MKDKSINLKRSAFAVTLACSLNCKLCAAYVPYISNVTHPSLEKWKEYMEKFFSIVDNVEMISISGGEPLLFKELPELMEVLLGYSKQYEKVEIITNGTVIPSKALLDVIKRYEDKFDYFLIDNYGKDLSKRVSEIEAVLKEYDIAFSTRDYYSENLHCGGWVDFGITEEIKHQTKESCEELYSKCAYPQKLRFCFSVRPDGYISPCPPIYYRIIKGHKIDPNDYIDLNDETLSIEQQRQKIINIYYSKCLETCAYCNGLCDDSPRFQPAEQLTKEEMARIVERERERELVA